MSVAPSITDLAAVISPPLLPDDARLAALWLDEAKDSLPEGTDEAIIRSIAAIIYAAPHLHTLIKRYGRAHPLDITSAIKGDISPIIARAQSVFDDALHKATDDDSVIRELRHYRYRCYLALALAELHGSCSIQEQMCQLSDCAAHALRHCLSYLCRASHIPETAMVIMAMGKLGARELNYSSDIDLIVIYDGADSDITSEAFVKLTRKLVQIFQKQTGDGFAWRVDLRLRPDPGATAIALSYDAAISYYESLARSWERAVFIRARPVAGNIALGDAFLAAISPFIWRRQLDYTILSDLTPWITHYPMPENGHAFDVKKGAFAIRHIEMMTHLLQMLHAGRDNSLRTPHTDDALRLLAKAGHLSDEDAVNSIQLYWLWRLIEHRLQYCRDAHLYHLPHNEDEFTQFARFLGIADAASLCAFVVRLQNHTKSAASHTVIRDMLAAHQGAKERGAWPADEASQLVFLTQKGFERPQDIIRTIDSWFSGRLPATRSERARQTLANLLPLVMTELSQGSDSDAHFMGFAQFVEALPAGVQVFTLLHQHPQLIELITNFTLSAPALMQELTKNPQIFEQMLDESFFAPLYHRPDFREQLASEIANKPFELQLDAIRLVAKEAKFRAEAHLITYPHAINDVHDYLTDLADACLEASFAMTIAAFEAQYGTVEESDFACLLLGRAGVRKLTPQSDVDVIFLYEGDRQAISNGEKQLSCTHYYQRLAQRLVSWITSKTANGILYEIDTRLRPDGTAGPLATHFESWQHYLDNTAWPFEKLALHKARILGGDNRTFTHRITQKLAAITTAPLARDAVIKDITLLRQKLAATPQTQWDFKKRAGGLLDCEFLRYLGDESGKDIEALWHHLTMMTSVMMPKGTSQSPPASFQKELCRLMEEDDFAHALAAMEAKFTSIAERLDAHLGA